MKAFLAALVAVVVIFVAARLVVDGLLRDDLSAATAHSVAEAVRLDSTELPPVWGELSPRPPEVIPPLVQRTRTPVPSSVRLDPEEVAVRGAVPGTGAHE